MANIWSCYVRNCWNFFKNPALESQLGVLVALMLSEMTERGHDSARIAVYRDRVANIS